MAAGFLFLFTHTTALLAGDLDLLFWWRCRVGDLELPFGFCQFCLMGDLDLFPGLNGDLDLLCDREDPLRPLLFEESSPCCRSGPVSLAMVAISLVSRRDWTKDPKYVPYHFRLE